VKAQFAFYKGPPRNDWQHTVSHYAIRLWTWSRWSHAELVVDGICYSSSTRDGGVRSKLIDLNSGRWDVIDLDIPVMQVVDVLLWFEEHKGAPYDWAGVWRFVLPFLPHSKGRWFCFEALGAALGSAGAHKLTANDLYTWAKARAAVAL
jgi:hypothetical protein